MRPWPEIADKIISRKARSISLGDALMLWSIERISGLARARALANPYSCVSELVPAPVRRHREAIFHIDYREQNPGLASHCCSIDAHRPASPSLRRPFPCLRKERERSH